MPDGFCRFYHQFKYLVVLLSGYARVRVHVSDGSWWVNDFPIANQRALSILFFLLSLLNCCVRRQGEKKTALTNNMHLIYVSVLPSMQPESTKVANDEKVNNKSQKQQMNASPKTRQRLIHVDKSIFNVNPILFIHPSSFKFSKLFLPSNFQDDDLYNFNGNRNGQSIQSNSGNSRNSVSGFNTVCRKTRELGLSEEEIGESNRFYIILEFTYFCSFVDENGRMYRQCNKPCENRLECKYIKTFSILI